MHTLSYSRGTKEQVITLIVVSGELLTGAILGTMQEEQIFIGAFPFLKASGQDLKEKRLLAMFSNLSKKSYITDKAIFSWGTCASFSVKSNSTHGLFTRLMQGLSLLRLRVRLGP